MSSRAEQKQRLKEERLKAEEAERARATRGRRLGIVGAVAVIAVAAVVIALVATNGNQQAPVKASTASAGLFDGIPQQGLTLGSANAPVTVEEYLDLQCPICKAFSENGLDVLVNDYVRTGKVKLVMRPIAILGDDSKTAADVLLAASQKNRAWNFAETFYANQGTENSGYVTDEFLTEVVKKTTGLPTSVVAGRNADAVQALFDKTATRQASLGVESTPSFFATTGAGKPTSLPIQVGDPSSVNTALDPIVKASS